MPSGLSLRGEVGGSGGRVLPSLTHSLVVRTFSWEMKDMALHHIPCEGSLELRPPNFWTSVLAIRLLGKRQASLSDTDKTFECLGDRSIG